MCAHAPATRCTRLRRSLPLVLLLLLLVAASCSRRRTTPWTRFWQGFTTRYNVLYHGDQALAEGQAKLLSALADTLPPHPTTYYLPLARDSARALFVRARDKAQLAIAEHSLTQRPLKAPGWRRDPKALAAQARQEHNPVLWRAWLLLGQSHYFLGQLPEAEQRLEQMRQHYLTEPVPYAAASLWLARLYAETGRTAEAALLIEELERAASPALQQVEGYTARLALALASGDYPAARTLLPELLRRERRSQLRRYYSRLVQSLPAASPLTPFTPTPSAAASSPRPALYDRALEAYRNGRSHEARPLLDSLLGLALDTTVRVQAELLAALLLAQEGRVAAFRERLTQLHQRYPASALQPLVAGLLRNLAAGRQPGAFPIAPPELDWTKSDSVPPSPREAQSKVTAEVIPSYLLPLPAELRLAPYEVYFLLTAYHYSQFTQQLLELSPHQQVGRQGFRVWGFTDRAAALRYRAALEQDAELARQLGFAPRLEELPSRP